MQLSPDVKELQHARKDLKSGQSNVQDQDMMLSYTQESLWLLERMCRESGPAFNEPLVFHLKGAIRIEFLARSLQRIVERHESLRTTFTETTAGLRAAVHEAVDEFVQIADFRSLGAEGARRYADAAVFETYNRPFDLASGPLIRAVIARIADDECLLGITIHHIVTDGWSMKLLIEELGRHYIALSESRDLPPLEPVVPYSEYVQRLRQEYEQGGFEEKIEYWKNVLGGASELLNLPVDRLRPATQSFKGSTFFFEVPKARIAGLFEKCAETSGTTEFVALLSAYAVLLSRISGQDMVTVGTTVLNRGNYDDIETIGCFVNTAALSFSMDEGLTLRELVARTAQRSLEMLNNQDAPYPKVLERLGVERDPSSNPLFQTMMTSLGKKPSLNLGGGIACRNVQLRRTGAKYDLVLYISETADEYEFEAEYNADLFDSSTIERLMGYYVYLLEQLAADINVSVSLVDFIPGSDRKLLLEEWNDTRADYPRMTVIDSFEVQAAKTPDAVAVQFKNRTLTYQELNRQANRVSQYLLADPGRKGEFIGVFMDRSFEMVVALVSILKAGLAYVPIDPEYPSDRIAYMIEDSGVPVILTQRHHRHSLEGVEAEIIVMEDLNLPSGGDQNPVRELLADSSVYMIYTSGSTGRPKGVVNRHVSLFNRLYWMQETYWLNPGDRILQKTPFSFDVSVWEFFWPLMVGASIVMAEPGGHRDPDYLKQVIQENGVTVLHFVPSMLNVFLEEEGLEDSCGSLRLVFCSGEALPYSSVRKFRRTLSCELHNLYGPTEAAIDVSHWSCHDDYPGNVVPIGRPIANTRLYILDKHMQLQPVGAPGELHIGGVSLAKGYHNRDDQTLKAFVPDPFSAEPGARLYKTGDLARFLPDGQIQYLGRIDNQVKLRGFRIELGEIEAIVRSLPGVKDAAVILHEANGNRMLCAYVAADEFDPEEAREQVSRQLPEFMVPRAFIHVQRLLTTANGKLDRKSLPEPLAAMAPDQTDPLELPTTEEQRTLSRIWSEVLGQEHIGLNSNFFRLGGDSILSIRVAARLREEGYKIEVHEMFANPTIRQLAQKLTLKESVERSSNPTAAFGLVHPDDRLEMSSDIEDAWPVTSLQSGMLYHSMLHEDSPVYHDIFTYDIQAPVDRAALFAAIRAVANNRPQLRTAFNFDQFSEPLQLVHRSVEPPVGVADLSGLPFEEQDRMIVNWSETEKGRPFDFAEAPLYRVQFHIRSVYEFNLGLSFHHSILDGWSVSLVLSDFLSAYADILDGKEPVLKPEEASYGDYVALERQVLQCKEHEEYWGSKVSAVAATPLFGGPANGAERQPGILVSDELSLPAQTGDKLDEIALRHDLPVKSILLAIHLKALSRLSPSKEVVSGLVVNGRPEIQGGEGLAGLFLNTIPLPVKLPEEDWPTLFRNAFVLEQQVMPHRRYPLVEILKRSGKKALFDVAFNYTDFHAYSQNGRRSPGIVAARYFEHTNIPVVVHAHRDPFQKRLRLIINYDSGLAEAACVRRYLDYFLESLKDAGIDHGGLEKKEDAAPPTELEKQIAGIVSEALGTANIALDDDFVRLGLDSIMAIRVVARIKRLGIKLGIKDVFDKTTVRQLAQYGELRRGQESIMARTRPFDLVPNPETAFAKGVVDVYPVTSMQLYMIEKSQIDVEQAVYQDVFSYHFSLPLKKDLLLRSLAPIIDNHELFRTVLDLDGYPVPMQLVYKSVPLLLEVTDLGALTADERDRTFHDWFESEKGRGFDLTRPLIRFHAHRYGEYEFKLTLSFHHALIDGWSLSLFMKQWIENYAAALSSKEATAPKNPVMKYRDYVRLELESKASAFSRAFWTLELKGYRYNSLRRPAGSGSQNRWSETKVVFDSGLHQSLSNLANRLGVPLKHVLLTGHLAAIGLLCGETDVLTGVFGNGRPEEEEGEDVLGMFLNFLPVRQKLSGLTWAGLIHETFEKDLGRLTHRRYPLDSIMDDLGSSRLFETIFNYTQFKSYFDLRTEGYGSGSEPALKDVKWFEHTDFLLLTNMGHDLDGRLVVTLNADGHVLSQAYIERTGELYVAVFAHMVADELALVDDLQAFIPERLAVSKP
ncbi:non-ribosomal peptide synthetase [Paenibacillus zanthoxyli]|uniref:non-ribosomal peptide synthetase n=1 Tax=Paenibacillus zanthoxyli TaxID=369399 RepID=UPI00046E6C83|nr:non-ribosomal peptide synthetase [Paenibacillus zanthoxyli]